MSEAPKKRRGRPPKFPTGTGPTEIHKPKNPSGSRVPLTRPGVKNQINAIGGLEENRTLISDAIKGKKEDIPDEAKLFTDFPTYSRELLCIRTKTGSIKSFDFNIVQQRLHKRLQEEADKGNKRRLILKYRRAGITTYFQAKAFHLVANSENQQAVTLAHDVQSTGKIFDISLLYYDRLPVWARPSRKTENKRELNFHNLGSMFYIGTAGGKSFGRGMTLQRVHGSEVAFWPKSADTPNLIAGLMEACSHGEMDLETTANGYGNWFYKTWHGAKSGENSWVPIFLSWKDDPELQIATPLSLSDLHLNMEEEQLVRAYKLLPSQILWRRSKMRDLFDPDSGASLFRQEYPINDVEAFISSGLAFFDSELLARVAVQCKQPMEVLDNGRLKIWHAPKEYRSYVIGADIGEGVVGGNRTVIVVVDSDECEEVASWAGVCSPEDAARKIADLGKTYNNALAGPEANNYGHSTLNTLLNQIGYPFIYEHADYTPIFIRERGDSYTPKFGWQTTMKTRPLMLSELRYALQSGLYKPNDPDLISECLTFVDAGHGKFEAAKDSYDDRIFAHAIAWQIRKKALEDVSYQNYTIDVGVRSILNELG